MDCKWVKRGNEKVWEYAMKIVLGCNKNGIKNIPKNIQTKLEDAMENEVENDFIEKALIDAIVLCLGTVPIVSEECLEALVNIIKKTTDLEMFVTGEYLEYLKDNDYSYFGEDGGLLKMLNNDGDLEDCCLFLSMVALVRYVASNNHQPGELLYVWSEFFVDYRPGNADKIAMKHLGNVIEFYIKMNENDAEYEEFGVFENSSDIDFFQISTEFVLTNNAIGVNTLMEYDRFWPDVPNQMQSYEDIFCSQGLEPEFLYWLMQKLGGKYQHEDHTFETAFMDWMSMPGMITNIIEDTEDFGYVRTGTPIYSKFIKCVHVMQIILAHSPRKEAVPNQWSVGLPFKFLMWILRSFNLEGSELNHEIKLWIIINGDPDVEIFQKDKFCGLLDREDEYGKHIADFLKMKEDMWVLLHDCNTGHNQRFRTTKPATLTAIQLTVKEMFKVFKTHFWTEMQGRALLPDRNCYENLSLHYNKSIHELYNEKINL